MNSRIGPAPAYVPPLLPLADFWSMPAVLPAPGLKRLVDIVGAVVGLVVLSPLLAVIAVAIRLDDPLGPVLYRQRRVGHHGRTFTIVKFRSMRSGADGLLALLEPCNEASGPLFKVRCDPRVTRVGAVLRKFSLDELPQLWNVLRGDMSLVGPRPALPREVAQYCPQARRRLEVLPGMTGEWQVSGRSTLDWHEGLALDLLYVDNWSLGYDAVLLCKTVRAVIAAVGAY